MRTVILVIGVLLAIASPGLGGEQGYSPHHMTGPDGSLDMSACGVCHEEDMTLSRSKTETCTLCHPMTVHAGAALHLRASAASVAQLLPAPRKDVPALPLTDDGRLYCGSCHLFHDPAMGGQQPLAEAWVPPSTGLPGAVRSALAAQWKEIEQAYRLAPPVAVFATKGTTALRLPIADGSLCRHCHWSVTE